MKLLRNWFAKETPPERRSAPRVLSPWLVAYDWSSGTPKTHSIRDISTSGVYLLTGERWQPGELVSISLHRNDRGEQNPGHGIPVQVRAVRWGNDGVGLSFVQAKDMDMSIMESPLTPPEQRKEPEAVRRKLRMAKASAFVDQICPAISEDVKVLFRDRLSTFRVGNAIEIALKAEWQLKREPHADGKRVHPFLIMRILENGSWADDNAIQEFWAGLLVASCADEGMDVSNMDMIDLFSDLASDHIRIFAYACDRAANVETDSGTLLSAPVLCTMKDLTKITNLHDLSRIDVDIDHLTVFGLLKKRFKPSSYTSLTETAITPTSLGLELYARCHGHRGAPEEFYRRRAAKREKAPAIVAQ
jgi:hypothetical protein